MRSVLHKKRSNGDNAAFHRFFDSSGSWDLLCRIPDGEEAIDWGRLHHLHYGIFGGLISAVAGMAGLFTHNLDLAGWSALTGVLMFGWAFDSLLAEKWGVNTPASRLDRWLLKFWVYDRLKKWVNKIFKKDG